MSTSDRSTETGAIALAIKVDGGLLCTGLRLETLWAALSQDVLATLWVLITCWHAPVQRQQRLLSIAKPDLQLLPRCAAVLDLAQAARRDGRCVVLISRGDATQVQDLTRQLGVDAGHHVANADTAAAWLAEHFATGGFDYVGHSREDLAPWRHARRIIAVAPGARLAAHLGALGRPVQIIGKGWRPASILREMRPWQWVKNLLLLLAPLAAHDLPAATSAPVLLALVAFCAAASSVYVLNDLLDLGTDRQHPQKKHRPIAAGALPIRVAMGISAGLATVALLISALIGPQVVGLLVLYLAVSLAYSLRLKRLRWLDLGGLATLYSMRVLTGAAAAQITPSAFLMAFVFVVFFTLAIVKRLTGLARATNRGRLPGRGYSCDDRQRLRNAALLGTLAAVACFLSYSLTDAAGALYPNLVALRLAALPIAVWLGRNIRLSLHGREDYDPVRFVEHDKVGLAIIAAGLALVLLALQDPHAGLF